MPVAHRVVDDLDHVPSGGDGRDVLRALCLGASAALIGRPYLWALAIAGEAGVAELLARVQIELENALALTGCAGVGEADRGLLARYP